MLRGSAARQCIASLSASSRSDLTKKIIFLLIT
jgi:hypothetical protein